MNLKKVLSFFLSGCLILSGSFPSGTVSAADYSRVSVHDPSVVKLEDGSYYIIGSHLAAARSKDLENWNVTANSDRGTKNTTFFNNIYNDLNVPEKWSDTTDGYDLSGNLWAPDIIYNREMKKYCMYLSVNGQQWNSSIVMCTADNIDGPYTYKDTIVYSGFTNNSKNNVNETDVPKVLGSNPDISRYLSNGSWNASYGTNAIDPAVFYDENGKLLMVYGSWFGGIYMLQLNEQTGLRDYSVKYETRKDISDAYMGKKIAGGYFNSGEGPYIEYMKAPGSEKGYYYLFVSYGYFNSNGGYNMRIFRSEDPQGPYVDQNGNSAIYKSGINNIGGSTGERLMSNYQWSCNDRPFKAQGHNSALMDDDGKLYVIYHTKFDDAYGFHEVRVHQMIMNEDGWPAAAPYEYTGESVSQTGHTLNAAAGEYEMIIHTLDQKFVNEKSADVEKPKNITLNKDGTITGDVQGGWRFFNGSPYMTISLGGVTYKGSFLVQADESSQMVKKMTFTATGNNTCIWGSKKSAYVMSEDITGPDFQTDNNAEYTLKNVNSGLYLSAVNNSAVQSSEQNWQIKRNTDGSYSLLDISGKALTVENNSPENGADIVLEEYRQDISQKFSIKLNSDGSYSVLSLASGGTKCLDVFEISKDDGANICQWEYWDGAGQRFFIEPSAVRKIPGDINSDSVVNVSDLLYLQKYLLGIQTELPDTEAADIDSDGRISIADFCFIKDIIIKHT